MQIFNNKGGGVIIARLGRWLNDSASVIDESQLPSASHSAAYHPDHSDSILAIRLKYRRCVKFYQF